MAQLPLQCFINSSARLFFAPTSTTDPQVLFSEPRVVERGVEFSASPCSPPLVQTQVTM